MHETRAFFDRKMLLRSFSFTTTSFVTSSNWLLQHATLILWLDFSLAAVNAMNF